MTGEGMAPVDGTVTGTGTAIETAPDIAMMGATGLAGDRALQALHDAITATTTLTPRVGATGNESAKTASVTAALDPTGTETEAHTAGATTAEVTATLAETVIATCSTTAAVVVAGTAAMEDAEATETLLRRIAAARVPSSPRSPLPI